MKTNKSVFVTVLAWILIVFFSFCLLMSIMQNIMVHTIIPEDAFSLDSFPSGDEFWMHRIIFSNFKLVAALIGFLFLTFLLTAVGLLKRKNWARLGTIFILLLTILYTVFQLVFQWSFMDDFFSQSGDDDLVPFIRMVNFIRIFSLVVGLGYISLNIWLISRLSQKKVVAEFRYANTANESDQSLFIDS